MVKCTMDKWTVNWPDEHHLGILDTTKNNMVSARQYSKWFGKFTGTVCLPFIIYNSNLKYNGKTLLYMI